jgi:hypothetical protein
VTRILASAFAVAAFAAPAAALAQPTNPFLCREPCSRTQAFVEAPNQGLSDIRVGANTIGAGLNFSDDAIFVNGDGRADLITGAIGARIATNDVGLAGGSILDHVRFVLADGLDFADIRVNFDVDGFADIITSAGGSGPEAHFALVGLSSGITDQVMFDHLAPAALMGGAHAASFSELLTVRNGDVFRLTSSLVVTLDGEGELDFLNTAVFGFELPQGVSFESASGRLLAVPEPQTWALLIAGFGLAGGVLRRRRLAPA